MAGAPVGTFTQGGQRSGEPTTDERILAAGSIAISALEAFVVLASAGIVPWASWPPHLRRIMWREIVMFSLLSVMLSGASGSPDERAARTPIAHVRAGRRRWSSSLAVVAGHRRWPATSEKPHSELVVF